MELPLVSILITSYNRASYIEAAIESALNQTYSNVEIIITDNCSTDGTPVILEKYAKYENVHVYINETNIGQFPNRNKAAMLANGKYLKYLDSDDLLYPHSVSVMVSAMEKNDGLGFAISIDQFGTINNFFPQILSTRESLSMHYHNGLLFPGPGNFLYNRKVFQEIGGFEDCGLSSDNFLTLKIASKYPIVIIQRDLYYWRRHAQQQYNLMQTSLDVEINNFLFNKSVLLDSNSPLPKNLSEYFFLAMKIRLCRNIFVYLLQLQLRKISILIQTINLRPFDFVLALVPMKFFRFRYKISSF